MQEPVKCETPPFGHHTASCFQKTLMDYEKAQLKLVGTKCTSGS